MKLLRDGEHLSLLVCESFKHTSTSRLEVGERSQKGEKLGRGLSWPEKVKQILHFTLQNDRQEKINEIEDIVITGVGGIWREGKGKKESILDENTGRRQLENEETRRRPKQEKTKRRNDFKT